jgi:hypothetical protein
MICCRQAQISTISTIRRYVFSVLVHSPCFRLHLRRSLTRELAHLVSAQTIAIYANVSEVLSLWNEEELVRRGPLVPAQSASRALASV